MDLGLKEGAEDAGNTYGRAGEECGTSPSMVWRPIIPGSASIAKDKLKLTAQKKAVN
jgi:hypothetical protein